jgi:hypothetical protein
LISFPGEGKIPSHRWCYQYHDKDWEVPHSLHGDMHGDMHGIFGCGLCSRNTWCGCQLRPHPAGQGRRIHDFRFPGSKTSTHEINVTTADGGALGAVAFLIENLLCSFLCRKAWKGPCCGLLMSTFCHSRWEMTETPNWWLRWNARIGRWAAE